MDYDRRKAEEQRAIGPKGSAWAASREGKTGMHEIPLLQFRQGLSTAKMTEEGRERAHG